MANSKVTERTLAVGGGVALRVGAALTSALSLLGWSVGTLTGQYMSAMGMVAPPHTLVE